MNHNQRLFRDICNHLIFLTTYDEYGSSRSKGIEDCLLLSQELNQIGLVPRSGSWTQGSLRSFFSRTKMRSEMDDLIEGCDVDLIGAQAWEFSSATRASEVMHPMKGSVWSPLRLPGPTPCHTEAPKLTEDENWKAHEAGEIKFENKNILKNLKNIRHD